MKTRQSAAFAGVVVAVVMLACATSASAESPHPPFTAERFQEFETHPLLECLNEETRKGKMVTNRLRQENRPGFLMGAIEVYNRESEVLFRQLNDCYIVAQFKWGVTQPLSYDQFDQMRDVITKRCDGPHEKRYRAWQLSLPPSFLEKSSTKQQLADMMSKASGDLGDIIAIRDQCYRDVQIEWGFR